MTTQVERLAVAATPADRATGRARSVRGLLARPSALGLILAAGAFLRLWQINGLGYNSDEAVYAGQAAAISGDAALTPFFPIFRAHPILFQTLLSVVFQFGISDLNGRLTAAVFGLATIYVTYVLGRELYGERAGLLGAFFLALMPYHVVVTRQALLDGPLTFFATLTLYLLARFARTGQPAWLCAAGAGLGLTILSKTTGIVMLAASCAFFAISPGLRVRFRNLAFALLCMVLVVTPYPLTVGLAGQSETGQQYFIWQLFRPPNHDWSFYLSNVPEAIGPLVLLAALGGAWLLRRPHSWREPLLWSWVVVPVAFFQLWPTKGFQYLLPIAPALAVLAGGAFGRGFRSIRHVPLRRLPVRGTSLGLAMAGLTAITLAVPTWRAVQPTNAQVFLAGSGGVPGGREAGTWVRDHVPEGAQMLAIGPSMANIIQFYGHRKVYGLSVSPNPLHRNPAYKPVTNPDRLIRDNQLHYIVWDSFSAARSPYFSDRVLRYTAKYHGNIVHAESLALPTPEGGEAEEPMVVIYEVRP